MEDISLNQFLGQIFHTDTIVGDILEKLSSVNVTCLNDVASKFDLIVESSKIDIRCIQQIVEKYNLSFLTKLSVDIFQEKTFQEKKDILLKGAVENLIQTGQHTLQGKSDEQVYEILYMSLKKEEDWKSFYDVNVKIKMQQDRLSQLYGIVIEVQFLEIFEQLTTLISDQCTTEIIRLVSSCEDLNIRDFIMTWIGEKNPNIFQDICLETTYFENEDYIKTLKQIRAFFRAKKIEKCNDLLQKLYGINKLASIALYIKHKVEILGLEDPKMNEIIEKVILQLSNIQIPPQCQEIVDDMITFLSINDFQSTIDIIFNFENYGEEGEIILLQICPIIQEVIPVIGKKFDIKNYFKDLQVNPQDKLITDQLCEALLKEDNINIVKTLKQLINQEPDLGIILYPNVLKYYPQIEEYIEYNTIIVLQAPMHIRFKVTNIMEILETNKGLNELPQNYKNKIINLFNDIYYDSPVYFENFYNNKFIRSHILLKEIQKPLSLEQISINSLIEINKKMEKLDQKVDLNIMDFMTVVSDFIDQNFEKKLIEKYENDDIIDAEVLKQLLFDYIKRRCTFSDLITLLSKKKSACQFTRQIFFNFLKKNSDENLKTLLYMASSSFMPVPLVSYDWEQGERTPVVCEQLFYTFEKYKSIFTFKLSSNNNKGPIGCTSLINDLFQKDFEKHQQERTNFGCIDIQFDYNFASPMCVPVADAHGFLETDILQKTYILFDIFIIHIINNEEDQKLLQKEVQFIQNLIVNSLIIIIEHDDKRDTKGYEYEKDINKNYHLIKTYPYENLLEQEKVHLKDQIFVILIKEIEKFEDYKGDYATRIKSMELFNLFLRNFNIDNRFIEQALKLTKIFLKEIEENVDDLHSEKFLPMNHINEQIFQVQSYLLSKAEIDQSSRDSLRNDLIVFQECLKTSQPTKIISILTEIVDSKNFLGLISIIAKLLRGLLDNQMNPLLIQRTELRSLLQDANLDQLNRENNIQQIKDLTGSIEAKWFCSEFVMRELYQLAKVKNNDAKQYEKIYMDLTELQIQQAQPFEVIDGNNLQFVSGIYDKIYKEHQVDQDQVLVVSIIGPQSSGKSLLLNFLFGTQFLSAAGRCTKGVYASILNIKSSSDSKYKKIILLDTEGIQSADVRDDQFDKRIVFYILSISHVILICNQGEMNNQMSEVIKLASDAISALKETVIQAPSINIIMNMQAQINEKAMEASIQKLSDAILEMDNGEKINKLFQITKENVFILPYAFNRSGEDKMIVNKPSQEFTKKLQPLRKKILDRVLNFDKKQAGNFTLYEWFKFADNFWAFTLTFKGMVDYSTLDQKKQDSKITDKITFLVEERFWSQNDFHKKYLKKQLENILQKYEGIAVTNLETISLEINGIIDEKFASIQKEILEEFTRFCGDENINSILRDKRQEHLKKTMNYYQIDWKINANDRIAIFSDKKSKIIGDSRLLIYMNKAIADQDDYTYEQAQEKFNEAWNNIELDVQKLYKSKMTIANEIFQLIHSYYKNEIIDKHFENIDLEKLLLQSFQQIGNQSLINLIELNKQKMLFFIGNNINSNIDKIIETLTVNKIYATQIPNNLFFVVKQFSYYSWAQVIQERFNFGFLSEELYKAYFNFEPKFTLIHIQSRKTSSSQLKKIIRTITDESMCFNIMPTEELEKLIANFDIQVNSQREKKGHLDQDNYFSPILNKIVNYIQDNIYSMFKYYPGQTQYKKHLLYYSKRKINVKRYESISRKYYKEDYINPRNDQEKYQGEQYINSSSCIQLNMSQIDQNAYDLKNYFSFLENPSRVRLNETGKECLSAFDYFTSKINWEIVIRKIEEIVLENYKVDGNFVENENVTEWEKQLQMQTPESQYLKSKFCGISRKLIQSIANKILLLIKEIDDEIEPFSLKMSESGIQFMHLIGQTFINALGEQLQLLAENLPFQILQDSKKTQGDIFIAKLTSNDKATDSALAVKINENIFKLIQNKNTLEIKNIFKNNLHLIKNNFSKLEIIRNIEESAIKAAQESDQYEEINLEFELDQHSSEEESEDQYLKRIGEYKFKFGFRFGKKDVQENYYKDLIGPLKLRSSLDSPKRPLNRSSMSSNYQTQFENNNIKEETLQFYVDPKKLLKNKFNIQWKELAEAEISKQQDNYVVYVKNQIQKIRDYFKSFYDQLCLKQACILSTQIFLTKQQLDALSNTLINENQLSQDFSKDMKVQCHDAAKQYLISFIKGNYEQNDTFSFRDQTIVVNPLINLLLPNDIPSCLDDEIVKCIEDVLQEEGISMLGQIIQELLSLFEKQQSKIQPLNKDEIIGELLQEFKLHFIGCEEHCPLCRRQCDTPHKENESILDRKHLCNEGHQIQGFGGNRIFRSNNAVTISCNELKDNDEIVYKEQIFQWAAVKQQFKTWNFETDSNTQLTLLKKKNRLIWNYIGRKVCRYYQSEKKITINFQNAPIEKIQKVHYILLLDRSGSMKGKNWDNLIIAVNAFLVKLEQNYLLWKYSRVSIIVYNHTSQKICYLRTPTVNLINLIHFHEGGGTNFDLPLRQAYYWLIKSNEFFDKQVLCFMSDGSCAYPKDAVNQIAKNVDIMSKLEFMAIGQGHGNEFAKTLEPMAKQLKGRMKQAINPNELTSAFVKLISNVYEC